MGLSLKYFIKKFGRHTISILTERNNKSVGIPISWTPLYGMKLNGIYHNPFWTKENQAEADIQYIKKKVYCQMGKKVIPGILRDFVVAYICDTQNVTASISRYVLGKTTLAIITGETSNIFKYLYFGLYDWVIFCAMPVLDLLNLAYGLKYLIESPPRFTIGY